MGVVFKCHDTVLDRPVAVKQLIGDLDEDPQLRRRFIQEARSAARLNHRNIITIYALHEAATGSVIVMELLEGVDLATLLKGPANLPVEVKFNLMAQVCDGLDYAHQRGIIHRDIKPANLHVSPAGLVKILDFGIAQVAASRMTSSGGLVGTPDYMSPEQVLAGDIDARSDLFAVGAVLYELLSGSRPFTADSLTALLLKIVHEPHVPLQERVHHLPVGAGQLVERLLAKNPNDRPSSAREVQEALRAISTERPVFDTSTIAMLASAVTERLGIPSPSTPAVSKATAPSHAPKDDSSSKLASLAIERGRALRESGDLAGAMRVFRSVLEVAPGNAEAMRELEQMEHAFAKLAESGPTPAQGLAARQGAAVKTPGGSSTSQKVPVPARNTPAKIRVAGNASLKRWGLVGAAVTAVVVLLGAAVYLAVSPHRAAGTGSASDARTASRQGSDPPSSTSSNVVSPPAIPSPPAVAAPPPPPPPLSTQTPAQVATPAPAPPGRSAAPPTNETVRRTPSRSTAADSDVKPRDTSPTKPIAVAPVPETSPVASSPPPVPAPEAAPRPAPVVPPRPPPVVATAASSVDVHHFHNRSLRRGFARGACDGELQLLPDGLYFRTTSSTDGRTDDKKIPFKDIGLFEIDGDRIRIESVEQNWEFGAPKDVLQRIEQHIKANKKEPK